MLYGPTQFRAERRKRIIEKNQAKEKRDAELRTPLGLAIPVWHREKPCFYDLLEVFKNNKRRKQLLKGPITFEYDPNQARERGYILNTYKNSLKN